MVFSMQNFHRNWALLINVTMYMHDIACKVDDSAGACFTAQLGDAFSNRAGPQLPRLLFQTITKV